MFTSNARWQRERMEQFRGAVQVTRNRNRRDLVQWDTECGTALITIMLQSYAMRCTSNSASPKVSGINIDKTAPIVSCKATPNMAPDNKMLPIMWQ